MFETRSSAVSGIDSHAHVFTRDLSLVSSRRYAPNYDATLNAYQTQLNVHGLSHGVLVQPSFLGTDNSYLLAALQQAPAQLRGVVVVEPGISRQALNDLNHLGVVGIRLNLMGQALPDFHEAVWRDLFNQVADLDWHVELHRNVSDLPALIRQLVPSGVKIVIDHFGRPDARAGLNQPGFAELLELGASAPIWIKVSGIYRLGGTPEQAMEFARMALPLLEQSVGAQRLVWGSDWPHTQHESSVGFGTVIQQLQSLECSASLINSLMVHAPARLFKFDRQGLNGTSG